MSTIATRMRLTAEDKAAIDHGLNGIAYPADGMVAYAQEQGFTVA